MEHDGCQGHSSNLHYSDVGNYMVLLIIFISMYLEDCEVCVCVYACKHATTEIWVDFGTDCRQTGEMESSRVLSLSLLYMHD